MKGEALRLKALQLALDQHAGACGCPVRALQMNPFECGELDWEDFGGIPIEPSQDLPTGVVRIDCLTTTIRDAYEDFKKVARDGSQEDHLDAAEQRFESKLEQLSEKIDENWPPMGRDDEWWKKAALREPDIYRRMLRGWELTRNEKLRLEIAQLPAARDRDLTDLFERWDEAYREIGVNIADLGKVDEEFADAWDNLPSIMPNLPSKPALVPAVPAPRSLWGRLLDKIHEIRLRRDLRRIGKRLR